MACCATFKERNFYLKCACGHTYGSAHAAAHPHRCIASPKRDCPCSGFHARDRNYPGYSALPSHCPNCALAKGIISPGQSCNNIWHWQVNSCAWCGKKQTQSQSCYHDFHKKFCVHCTGTYREPLRQPSGDICNSQHWHGDFRAGGPYFTGNHLPVSAKRDLTWELKPGQVSHEFRDVLNPDNKENNIMKHLYNVRVWDPGDKDGEGAEIIDVPKEVLAYDPEGAKRQIIRALPENVDDARLEKLKFSISPFQASS